MYVWGVCGFCFCNLVYVCHMMGKARTFKHTQKWKEERIIHQWLENRGECPFAKEKHTFGLDSLHLLLFRSLPFSKLSQGVKKRSVLSPQFKSHSARSQRNKAMKKLDFLFVKPYHLAYVCACLVVEMWKTVCALYIDFPFFAAAHIAWNHTYCIPSHPAHLTQNTQAAQPYLIL